LVETLAWEAVASAGGTLEGERPVSWKGAKKERFKALERLGFTKWELVIRGERTVTVHFWRKGSERTEIKVKTTGG
jgi:hypothetical protein